MENTCREREWERDTGRQGREVWIEREHEGEQEIEREW